MSYHDKLSQIDLSDLLEWKDHLEEAKQMVEKKTKNCECEMCNKISHIFTTALNMHLKITQELINDKINP